MCRRALQGVGAILRDSGGAPGKMCCSDATGDFNDAAGSFPLAKTQLRFDHNPAETLRMQMYL